MKFDLCEGRDITEAEIRDVLRAAEKDKIRQRAYRLLAYRDRSVAEMRQRLRKAGYDPDLVDETVQDLCADKTLDDERFSRALTDDASNLRLRGNLFVRRALRARRVAPALIEAAVRDRDERELIRKLLATKLARYNARDPKDRQRIIRALAYRGFALDAIFDVLGGRDE